MRNFRVSPGLNTPFGLIDPLTDGQIIRGTQGDDSFERPGPLLKAVLLGGDDTFSAAGPVGLIQAGRGNDEITLEDGGGIVNLGQGDDVLTFAGEIDAVIGGGGDDTVVFDGNLGDYDAEIGAQTIVFVGRFSGYEMTVRGVENFVFSDVELSRETLEATFDADAAVPTILVGGGTQTVTVNDPDPTISVIWDRVVQQAVIDTDSAVGPTIASRAYAMVHTAIYDAWASHDSVALRVSFDQEGNNAALEAGAVATEANKAKAMSFAAYTVLMELLPDQAALFDEVMQDRLGYDLTDDGSLEAAIGIDAAEDLLALRRLDGSNQLNGYDSTGVYMPVNPDPTQINDIARWTPENVPIDPENDPPAEQSFLTPQWGNVESFALPEFADGETDHSVLRPVAPQPFFIDGLVNPVLDFAAKTVTLGQDITIEGMLYTAGSPIPVSKALIGPVVNPEFIAQAKVVIDYSANLNDEQKIIAEFWEDGGGTAFPPGTFMTFAQLVSARDGHDLDTDAKMFLAMGNAVFDAGVATWEAKVFYDYARPVRAIRDLGELGLIGEEGVDELTGEMGYVIEAFGGFDPVNGEGLGTRTILAENFVTFQRPFTDPSPPFAEYTSGHSAFSAAGAEVLQLFTGSDIFGGSVVFGPSSTQFEVGVPALETVLSWDTFSEAADEAGLSRLYGGIHFEEGDFNGRALGSDAGALAYALAESFWTGTAEEADRPFSEDTLILI